VRSRPPAMHNSSVSQDWRMPLKGDKSHIYFNCIQTLEAFYSMFSVNLDEAFGMRRTGRVAKSFQVLSISPALCEKLAHPLMILLRTMLDHAKYFGVSPNVAPLNVDHFQSSRAKRVAVFNDLVSRVLLTRKLQFTHKISALADLVDELDSNFETVAEGLAVGDSLQPDHDWQILDEVHYDLNTCLREAVVILKSFLHALPEAQLSGFGNALNDSLTSSSTPVLSRARHLAHRRIAFLKGQ
jgi:hypothetical protein